MMKITNYGVTYIWSDNTRETAFVCASHHSECGDLYIPDYLKDALERYAKELEESEVIES
jgi:hypothetical protein